MSDAQRFVRIDIRLYTKPTPPTNTLPHHTWELLSQLRTLAATQLLHNHDVMQLYSKEFSFIEGTSDLDDEIEYTM
jgi:hypothetical protein